MKSKIILVVTYPPSMMHRTVDRAIDSLRKAAAVWTKSSEDNVLAVMLPEGCKVTGYAVPEEALVELPELLVRVEPEEVKRQDEVYEAKIKREVEEAIGATCPTCSSPDPAKHPAVQHEGEVQLCKDRFHSDPKVEP
jgi:hypothetical protein